MLEQIKEKLSSILGLMQFVKVSSDKGPIQISTEEYEDIAVGQAVSLLDEDGNPIATEDGEYRLSDGITLVVENGVITEIIPAPEKEGVEIVVEEMAEEEEPATEEPKAEEPEQTEIEKLREEVNELYKIVDSILDKIGESRKEADGFSARLAKVEKMSAAQTVEKVTLKSENKTQASIDKFNKMFNK